MYICVPLCVFVCESVKCTRRPDKDIGSGAGVAGNCELPDVDTGHWEPNSGFLQGLCELLIAQSSLPMCKSRLDETVIRL